MFLFTKARECFLVLCIVPQTTVEHESIPTLPLGKHTHQRSFLTIHVSFLHLITILRTPSQMSCRTPTMPRCFSSLASSPRTPIIFLHTLCNYHTPHLLPPPPQPNSSLFYFTSIEISFSSSFFVPLLSHHYRRCVSIVTSLPPQTVLVFQVFFKTLPTFPSPRLIISLVGAYSLGPRPLPSLSTPSINLPSFLHPLVIPHSYKLQPYFLPSSH